ncbi:16206_t:CDS:2 [Rhizophagus irregularis]|nr:16206_t:CDS:2 [Rhizophagus irregularis]
MNAQLGTQRFPRIWNGISQILFVVDQAEEIEILSKIEEILKIKIGKHTTVVRTKFKDFKNNPPTRIYVDDSDDEDTVKAIVEEEKSQELYS